jgi:hypothetical protein
MMGCTFLEFVTWFLMGLDAALEEFPAARFERDVNGIYADTYFRIVTKDNQVVSMVKPSVTAWIASLHSHEHCSNYIHDFLKLIAEHMLVTDPSLRFTALELSISLQVLYSRCQENAAYYQPGHPWAKKSTLEEGEKSTHDLKPRTLDRLLQSLRLNVKRVDGEN